MKVKIHVVIENDEGTVEDVQQVWRSALAA